MRDLITIGSEARVALASALDEGMVQFRAYD